MAAAAAAAAGKKKKIRESGSEKWCFPLCLLSFPARYRVRNWVSKGIAYIMLSLAVVIAAAAAARANTGNSSRRRRRPKLCCWCYFLYIHAFLLRFDSWFCVTTIARTGALNNTIYTHTHTHTTVRWPLSRSIGRPHTLVYIRVTLRF